ncbi:MAG: ABA4-like family protein [Pseudomonadota bacterium]
MPAADQLFGWAGQAAMLGWLVLVFLPRRWPWLLAVPRYIIPFGLSLLYAGLAMTHFFTIDGGGYGSLSEVSALLSKEEMLLAGWVHYLAFDLFIGGWLAVKADQVGLNRLVQAPILIATFMFGPIGLALFLTILAAHSRSGSSAVLGATA